MTADPGVLFNKLRAETCAKLDFDINHLSPWQEVKVNQVALLRLEEDRLIAAALRGEPIDPRAVSAIAEQLEKALHPSYGGDSPEAHAAADETARAKLGAIVNGLLQQREYEATEIQQREEAAAVAAAGEPPPLETLPPLQSSVPGPNVKHDYLDAVVLSDDPPPPAAPLPAAHQLRTSSANNPGSPMTPPAPHTVSPTYQAFADCEARRGSGFGRFDPPSGW